jgi:hypothetical protein
VGNPAQIVGVTKMTQAALTDKEAKKAALEARSKDMDEREKKLNEGKTGVGTRTFIAMTRGKNPQEIQYDSFDDTKPETLPKTIEEFLKVAELDPTKDESSIVSFLIGGFNDAAYTAASDPLREYVDPTWPPESQAQFRLVVRNYSRGAQVSIEDAVALIKPGFEKQFAPKA